MVIKPCPPNTPNMGLRKILATYVFLVGTIPWCLIIHTHLNQIARSSLNACYMDSIALFSNSTSLLIQVAHEHVKYFHYLLLFMLRLPSGSMSKLVEVLSTLMWQLYSGTPCSRVVRNSFATSGSLVIKRKSSTKRSSRPLRGLTLGRHFLSMSA